MEQATQSKPNEIKQRASYINPFVQDNVILLYAKGSSLCQIAKETGVNRATVTKLIRSESAQAKLNILKSNLADKIEEIARKMIYSIKDEEIPGISPAQRMTCVGIAVDKIQLLRSKPTNIIQSDVPPTLTGIINYVLASNKTQETQDIVKNNVIDTTGCEIKLT